MSVVKIFFGLKNEAVDVKFAKQIGKWSESAAPTQYYKVVFFKKTVMSTILSEYNFLICFVLF